MGRTLVALAVLALIALAPVAPANADSEIWPKRISLPNGFPPEGIAIGLGPSAPVAYFGSRLDGSIYQANLLTGQGSILSVGPGTAASGLKIDFKNRLFVAGGPAGDARVVDLRNGEVLATYQFASGATLVNDEVITPNAVWFTDSFVPVLYKLPYGRHGALPKQEDLVRLPLTGDITFEEGINANGIVTSPDGRWLIIVQSNTGKLFRVNPQTGATETVDLGTETVYGGDGMLREGNTLWVAQNPLNQVARLEIDASGRRGRVVARATHPGFDTPATIAALANRLYLPNARFTTAPTSTTPYDAVAIEKF